MDGQQRLFEHYNPLEKRVGKKFFEELPQEPGVNRMYGRRGELLYVGKAKNLRKRLFVYRRAKMGTTRSKIIRLIRRTFTIDFEICDSEKQSLLLENELIRRHKPEFNHAKRQPETYYYIGLKRWEEELEFSLRMHVPEMDYVFGAFKGHRLGRKTMGGIIRLLFMLEQDIDSIIKLPAALVRNLTPMKYKMPVAWKDENMKIVWPSLIEYLEGRNAQLMGLLLKKCRERELLQSFSGAVIQDDLDAMKWFYERCSQKNFRIFREMELETLLIPQERLDDYIIKWTFAGKERKERSK